MAGAVVFVPDRDGIGELLTRQETVGMLRDRAEDVAQRARSTAPVETGRYRDSITVEVVPGRTSRAAVDVVADVDYATLVEARTRTLGSSL